MYIIKYILNLSRLCCYLWCYAFGFNNN